SNRNCWARRTSSALCASRATYRGRVAVGVTRDLYALSGVVNCVLQELQGQRGPSGLMTCPAAATGFAVEIFVKQDEIAPVWVVRVFRGITMTWAGSVLVRQKDASQSARKLTRDLLEGHHVSRAGRALNLERFTIKQVVTFERFDD